MHFENVTGLTLTDILADYFAGEHALIKMKDASKALLRNIQATGKCNTLLQIEGDKTNNIRISEMDSNNYVKLVNFSDDNLQGEVKVLNMF